MATGDILSAVVRADGWSMDVTIEGFAVGAAYDFGSLDDSPATITAPMFSVAVVSEGYNAAGVLGTIARTVYGTHVVRKAYPNQASKDETVSGSDLVVRVALSESIYNDDKNGGAGTSGTNPAVTISAAWATNTGGGAQTSAVATALACTNNSTLDYPKVIAQWAWGHTPAFRRVAAAFDIGCIAYHGHGIACVALSATDAHAAAVSGTVTSKTDHAMLASGLHYESYDLAVPVTSFTEGDDITLRYIAYPLVGDADSIIDTSADTSTVNIAKGLTKITATYKTTGIVTKYVASTGNDATGDGSSGTPYATIGKALAQSPDIILIRTGSGAVATLGTTPASVTSKSYCIEVMPESGAITLNRTTAAYAFKAKHLRYSGFTIASAGEAYSFEDNTTYTLQFADCSITRTGSLPSQAPGLDVDATFYTNCSWNGRDGFGAETTWHYAITGCSLVGGFVFPRGMVATRIAGTGTTDDAGIGETSTGDASDNRVFLNNELVNLPMNTVSPVVIGGAKSATNTAFIGNIVESVAGALSQLISFCEGAGGGQYASNNTIFAHNTAIGQRCNIYYDDVGAVSHHTNAFFRNNALHTFNSKSDTFSSNALAIGNWPLINGVNVSDNRYDGTSGFPPDYLGINGSWVNAPDNTYGQMGYTHDASQVGGDGTGNGDYMPTLVSVLHDQAAWQVYQSFDLYGVAR